MALSLYQVSVPPFVRALEVLSTLLERGAAHVREHDIDPKTFIEARLAPDMIPLAGQIQRASDTAKGTLCRLTGAANPSFPDTESSFDELRARLAKTIEFAQSLSIDQFAQSDKRVVNLKMGPLELAMPGDEYLLKFGLPNFYFHVTTAYDILRHLGVAIGKRDFIGPLDAYKV